MGEIKRRKLGAVANTSSPAPMRSSMHARPTRFAIGCVFCVTSDVQVVDTGLNHPLEKAPAKEQDQWAMATAGDPENACKGRAIAPRADILRRVRTAYTDAHSSIDAAIECVRCGITPPLGGSRATASALPSAKCARALQSAELHACAIGRAGSLAGIYAYARAIP